MRDLGVFGPFARSGVSVRGGSAAGAIGRSRGGPPWPGGGSRLLYRRGAEVSGAHSGI